ncbi:hypothetical protein PR048_031793 [Dryococelus australis]|uniref:Uncharacterized protein n=1 Tax=Dryococelus australis TaxID=614101 RepID=A0ABQ9G697_9NEOP|nr:hypothetical protein PR048_031793 [Dryococelus australis]
MTVFRVELQQHRLLDRSSLHWDLIKPVRRTRCCHELGDGWEETTVKEMTIASKHEAQLHLERGDIDEL